MVCIQQFGPERSENMPHISIELFLNLLATFCSPLLSNRWLLVVTAVIASLLITSVVFKYNLNKNVSTAIVVGVTAFFLAPQPRHADTPTESQGNSWPTSTGVYGAPGSSTSDVYIGHSRFTGCDSGLENHGAMNNIIVDNSSFDCPPKFAVPPSAPPLAPLVDSSKAGQLGDPMKPRGTSGIYNSKRAVYNAAIDNFRSIGCEQGVRDIPSGAIWDNVLINCGATVVPPRAVQATSPSGHAAGGPLPTSRSDEGG
jgi:hypothetical protein